MPNIFSPAQIAQLKRDAQRIRRASPNLPQHAALDAVARQQGFSNWSLLAKSVTISSGAPAAYYRFARTREEMRQAMLSVRSADIYRNDAARSLVADISSNFVSPINAIEHAIAYLRSALSVARYRVHHKSRAYFEMRTWLPYHLEAADSTGRHILLGRDYKPLGMVQKKELVDYKAFPNLHVIATVEEVEDALPARPYEHSSAWFYGDAPWESREAADRYLRRLIDFRTWLAARP